MLPKNSEKKNKSDVNNFNKILTTYDGDLKCMGIILEVVQEERSMSDQKFMRSIQHAKQKMVL